MLHDPVTRLRLAGFIEGMTLVLLLGVAVPLKRALGMPAFVSVMGPLHGFAFMLYLVLLADTASGGGWPRREVARALAVCLIPFGTFFNDPFLRRKQKGIEAPVKFEKPSTKRPKAS